MKASDSRIQVRFSSKYTVSTRKYTVSTRFEMSIRVPETPCFIGSNGFSTRSTRIVSQKNSIRAYARYAHTRRGKLFDPEPCTAGTFDETPCFPEVNSAITPQNNRVLEPCTGPCSPKR